MRLDTLYTVETPEGIALSLRPAGLVSRGLAYLIDLAIRGALLFGVSMVVNATGAIGMGEALLFVSYFALEWLYPVIFELALKGGTPGKRALGLRVVMDSGLPVTPAASVLRNVLRVADFLPAFYGFGVAAMLLRTDFKRLGDMAAGTLVVYSDDVSLHGELPLAEPMAPALALSAREQAAIVSWAGRSKRLTPARFDELAALARPVLGRVDATVQPPVSDAQRLLGVAQWLLGRRPGHRQGRP